MTLAASTREKWLAIPTLSRQEHRETGQARVRHKPPLAAYRSEALHLHSDLAVLHATSTCRAQPDKLPTQPTGKLEPFEDNANKGEY